MRSLTRGLPTTRPVRNGSRSTPQLIEFGYTKPTPGLGTYDVASS
jgi:hypothetical protein